MTDTTTQRTDPGRPDRPLSMHEDVELWCDCCSCEAEPRWQWVEEEMEAEAQRRAKQAEHTT